MTDVKEPKVIPDDKIIEILKDKGRWFPKISKVIHVTKLSEKDARSSESSSDKKCCVVLSEEVMPIPWFKNYAVWLITYKFTSEGEIIDISVDKCPKDEKKFSKEDALEEAIDTELKKRVEMGDVLNDASEKIKEFDLGKTETADASEDVQDKETKDVKEDDVRNILLVGRTGDGKSAIANVLVDEVDENGKPYFKESAKGISETKEATIVSFLYKIKESEEYKRYRIIDTIGLGDTKLSFGAVLEKIIQAIHRVDYRLHHILFVTRGRMTREEVDTFNLLKSVIFCDKDKNNKSKFLLEEFTILVRSGICEFYEELDNDVHSMIRENDGINNLIKSCTSTIYVDNPPVYAESKLKLELAVKKANSEDDENDNKKNILIKQLERLEKEIDANKEKRARSRRILLESLEELEKKKLGENQKDHYKAKEMQELGRKIIPSLSQIKILQKIIKKISNDEELKEAYDKKKKYLENEVFKEIKQYADDRGNDQENKVTVIKPDENDKEKNKQFTKVAGATLISVGAIFMNGFVPGLGSGLSDILIGLAKKP